MRKSFLYFLLSFILLVFFVEASFWIFFKVSDTSYVDELKNETIIPHTSTTIDQSLSDERLGELIHYIPHPFWGYQNNPRRIDLNQKGFVYNQIASSDDSHAIRVHIYGGSFAEQMVSLSEYKNRVFIDNDKSCVVEFAARSISGGHQPQQLAISLTDLPEIDIGLNIDGFNDANASYEIDKNTYFNFQQLFLDVEKLSQLVDLLKRKKKFERLASFWMERSRLLSLSNSARFYLNFIFLKDMGKNIQSLNELFLQHNRESNVVEGINFKKWKYYTEVQAQAFKSYGKKFFNFIQPNLYLDGSKPWSSEEEKLRIDGRHANQWVGMGYQNFVNWYGKESFSFTTYSLVDVFKDTNKTAYIDSCCHLNESGYQIVWQKIFSHIEPELLSICRNRHSL